MCIIYVLNRVSDPSRLTSLEERNTLPGNRVGFRPHSQPLLVLYAMAIDTTNVCGRTHAIKVMSYAATVLFYCLRQAASDINVRELLRYR